MKEHRFTNNLINETSPYLLQHAHNPVNWFAWGDEALQKAVKEDKPILVSIGYSACHWCHVMERESFEDEATAQIMNEHFINIKIDREERPDIDHIYMDAVQVMTGSGGWPLNIFLTPDLKPFYGGTYYPPRPAFNRNSWQQVLHGIVQAYKEKRNEIAAQSENLTKHLQSQNILNLPKETMVFDKKTTATIAENFVKLADKEWGGFGQAPKFPQTFSILYLLRYHWLTGNAEALNVATISLDKMMMGGIYDHLGGGFCRYSTDRSWQIPHFEKMLYDNALLIDAFIDAYQLTKREDYATVVKETIGFIQSELTSPEDGFYSALDADSEGVEGKYYTWDKHEIDALLGDESDLFCSVFDISENGNWENTNILWLPEELESVAQRSGISKEKLISSIHHSRDILLHARQKRIRPGLDNKVLLSWNALFITGLCKAYAVLGIELYLQLAEKNVQFIEKHLFNIETGMLLHSWNKTAKLQPAFLDDYATLIRAYIFLHEGTQNNAYLLKARLLTEKVIEYFSDEEECFFYFTSKEQTDILLRKKEIYDGATPSGNSVMAENLFKLSVIFDMPLWKQRAESMMVNIGQLAEKYPVSFGNWCLTILSSVYGLKEIVVTAEDYRPLLQKVLQEYVPFRIVQAANVQNSEWPMLRGKLILPNQTKIYICENYNCLQPATSIEEFKNQLNKHF